MPCHPDRVRRNYGFEPRYYAMPVQDGGIPITITTGRSCVGFLHEGVMHETVRDAAGNVVEERHTPFEEWNRL